MGTVRLTHVSKYSDSQKIGTLAQAKKTIEKIIKMKNGHHKDLAVFLDSISSERRQFCNKGFQKCYAALNSFNTINELDPDDREEYAESIKETRVEAGEMLVDAISEFSDTISRLEHKMQITVDKKVSKNPVDDDLLDVDEAPVGSVNSLEDLKTVFDIAEKKRKQREAMSKKLSLIHI